MQRELLMTALLVDVGSAFSLRTNPVLVRPSACVVSMPVLLSMTPADAAAGKAKTLWPLFTLLALAPRGAALAAGRPTSQNYVAMAAELFFTVKIPATLIAGSAIGQLLEAGTANDLDRTAKDMASSDRSLLRAVYVLLVTFTVIAEISVVYITTASHVRLFAGGFDPIASSPVSLALRVVPLGFLATRCFFAMGIATFLLSIVARAALCYPAALAWPIATGSVTAIFGLLTFFNWERRKNALYMGFVSMFGQMVKLGYQALKGSATGWITMVGAAATFTLVARALLGCAGQDQSSP